MKVLFIQFEPQESLAIQYLSALLQKFGHSTDLIIVGNMSYPRVMRRIRFYQPGLICISDLGSDARWICCLSSMIKKNSNAKIVIGGYITLNKEEVFENDQNIDAYCIGSGFFLNKLIEHYESGYPAENIPNFFIRHNGVLVKNRLDGDSHLHDFKDKNMDIYRHYPFLYPSVFPSIMASYGCINNCSFCFYSGFRNKFAGKVYLCYKDPDSVVWEITQTRKINKNSNCFNFVDDNIMNNVDWLARLMSAIKPLKIKFYAKIDVNNCTEELIVMMRDAGLFGATIGIESINQEMRRSVLNKNFKNDKLAEVISWLKKYGVHIRAYFIIGLPNETEKNITDNVLFARSHGIKEARYNILGLLPHTVLAERINKQYNEVSLKQLFPFSSEKLTRLSMQQNKIFLPWASLSISKYIRKGYFFYIKLRYYPIGVTNLVIYGWRLYSYLVKEYALNIIDKTRMKKSLFS